MKLETYHLYMLLTLICLGVLSYTCIHWMNEYDSLVDKYNYVVIGTSDEEPNMDSIMIEQNVYDRINEMIYNNNEQSLCITGSDRYLEDYYVTPTNSTPGSSTYLCTQNNTLAVFHSHPSASCYLSNDDIVYMYFNKIKFMGVICGVDEIGIFSFSTDRNRIPYEVIQ